MSGFTPGPWDMRDDDKRIAIGVGLVEGPDGYDVAEVYADDCPSEVAEANARLIAAAPDLYTALEALQRWGILDTAESNASGMPSHYTIEPLIKAARDAIAKVVPPLTFDQRISELNGVLAGWRG